MPKRSSPYERELDGILASLASGRAGGTPRQAAAEKLYSGEGRGHKAAAGGPSLLLHACCAPCSSYVIEHLAGFFAITIFYYNPNIHPKAEYERRRDELLGFLPRFPAAQNVAVIEGSYDPEDFFRATRIREERELQTEAEKGERCRRCYELRMRAAWRYACGHGFDWFTTTLSISPFKDADKINSIGKALEKEAAEDGGGESPRFLPSDFKKKGGFKRSLELSAEYGLYRQDYCGCACSKANRGRPLPKTDGSC